MSVSEVKAGMPFAGTMVAKYLDKQIDALKGVKTQREIALEAGYDKPNIISMFKRGEAKGAYFLPLYGEFYVFLLALLNYHDIFEVLIALSYVQWNI